MEPESSNWLGLYAKHVLIAWPGIFLATLVVGILVSATPLVYLFSPDLNAPWFPGMVISGLLAGFYFNARDRCASASWVFALPLAYFFWSTYSEASLPPYGGFSFVWQNYFTRNCGATECLGELLATGPLYAGVAYSIGAWWVRHRGPRRSRVGTQHAVPGGENH